VYSFTQGDSAANLKPGTSSVVNISNLRNQAMPADASRCTALSNSDKHTGHVQLDLMTDEEIPPRGEISEYEESNTSSFVSEDSVCEYKLSLSNQLIIIRL
jgi:hypothetical protein